ncbi:hypothetical protein HER10_EVM0011411 [Colletotrichum scovillei]|uniref:uncharacterized protein n=1 Tax=Colletotrichum scovillei TaxID=1209932 RepID=UPI0015C2CD93|nr:uncharacterized protein HER10_EVM0011411 [Colletotrichum scovillei]KAF4772751.1 hypothetical protein HER10_EVM0011411 [Colletotrichum scovillei]
MPCLPLPPTAASQKPGKSALKVRELSPSRAARSEQRIDACREANIMPPVFQLISDRRGGRTAWSSRVTVHGRTLSARFWYDGKNLNNAKEDAAEMALNYLTGPNPSQPSQIHRP